MIIMPLEKLEKELEDTKLVKSEQYQEAKDLTNKEFYSKVVKFATEARKAYGDIIKSVLIFGSAVRGDALKTSDIDVWVLLDDTATKVSEDLNKVQAHLQMIASELKDIHVQIHTLTAFWHSIRMGSPEFTNFLRYGLPVYDLGFIKPVQRMLQMGLIPPSEEAITLKARSAEVRFKKINLDIKSMIFELRYTVLDIVQAVVMYYYKEQPDAKKAPEFLEKLVAEKGLEKEYVEKFKQIDQLWKDIDHKIIKDVTVEHLNKAISIAKDIIERFKKMLPEDILGEEPPELEL
jgi:predicted nucleotidyltransferase